MRNKKQLNDILKQNIPLLAKEYFDIILEKKGKRMYGSSAESRIVTAFENIISKMPIVHTNVEMETTADVIKAVSEGKISITEAKELMALLREQQEIDVLPELVEAIQSIEPE